MKDSILFIKILSVSIVINGDFIFIMLMYGAGWKHLAAIHL